MIGIDFETTALTPGEGAFGSSRLPTAPARTSRTATT